MDTDKPRAEAQDVSRANSSDEEKDLGRQLSVHNFAMLNDQGGGNEMVPGAPPLPAGTMPQSGVTKAQAFNRVLYESGSSGRLLLATLVVSIGCTMFAYALDQGITYQFTVAAASSFGRHAEIGAVGTAAEIIRAISKPFLAKVADITSRPTTYTTVLVFYAIGFAVAASCTTLSAYIVGIAFTAFGKSGLDLLGDIIVADLTTLQWRGFVGSLLSTPFLVTTFVDGFISEAFVPDQWRWGLGMFAIMVPILLTPAIATLYFMQRKAQKMGMVSAGASGVKRRGQLGEEESVSWTRLAYEGVIDIDLAGLILLGFGFALVLLPFNLVVSATGGWSNPSMIAMIVLGFVILIAFGLFECFVAPKPLMTKAIIKNRAFMAAVGTDVCTQMASGLRTVYWASYIWVIKNWTNYVWTVFLGTVTLGLCFLGPVAGLIQRKTHRYKSLMVFGAVLKLIGNGVLLAGGGSNRSTRNTAALAIAQVLFSFGAFTVVGARVGSQASVPHEDVATVIAGLSLWSTLGSSVGYSISTAIWTNLMVSYMQEELPTTPPATIRQLYGKIVLLRRYPWGSPVREGGMAAYQRVMGLVFIVSTCLAALALLFSLLMPNFYLGKQQNAVTNRGLDGRPVDVPDQQNHREPPKGVWAKMKRAYYKE